MPAWLEILLTRSRRERARRRLDFFAAEMWEKGAAGERVVQEMLAQLPPEWAVFHDLHWPGRARANIDHLVVGPCGVFVIDAKNWSGSLQIRNGVLRQNGYRRDAVVDSAREAAVAVASLAGPLTESTVTPILCFTGEAAVEGTQSGVILCSASNLVKMLLERPVALTPEELGYLRFELDMSTRAATGPVAAQLSLPPLSRSPGAMMPSRPSRAAKRSRGSGPPSRLRTLACR